MKIEGPYAKIGYYYSPIEDEDDAGSFIDYIRRGIHIDYLDLATRVVTNGHNVTDFVGWESNPLVGEVLELCENDNNDSKLNEAIVGVVSPWIAEIARHDAASEVEV